MDFIVNGQVFTENGAISHTFLTRFRGLMGRTVLPTDFCLLLTPCSSIHMAFMKIPLDVAYLDKSGLVIAIQKDLQPWRIGEIHKGAYSVLEAPVDGVVKKLKIGDRVSW